MTKRWVPLSARGNAQEEIEALYEGVPAHLKKSLWEWLRVMLFTSRDEITGFDGFSLRTELLQQFERYSRRPLPWRPSESDTWDALVAEWSHSDEFVLDLVDFVLGFAVRNQRESEYMEKVLVEAGSAWSVVPFDPEQPYGRRFKLERRVPEPVATAAREAMSAGRAGQHLAQAWSLIYGRHPDPNGAYLEAVKAVEAAMVPVISPNNARATLGTMLRDMKENAGKFLVEMPPIDNAVEPFEVVRSACQLLWKAQPDRHGTPEERAHSNVSQKTAEGAVHLAVTLVQWFSTGVVRRR